MAFGFEKIRRPLFLTGGAKVTGNSTFDGNVTISGDLTQTGTITASSGTVVPVTTVSSSEGVPNHGIVMFESTAAGNLAHPLLVAPVVGQEVTFINKIQSGSSGVNFILSTTADVGATVLILSTASTAGRRIDMKGVGAYVTIVGLTTSAWGVTNRTPTTQTVIVGTTTV